MPTLDEVLETMERARHNLGHTSAQKSWDELDPLTRAMRISDGHTALLAAQDAGASLQPDNPTEGMLERWGTYDARVWVCDTYRAMTAASPYRVKDDD